jgi:hypothetical protein
MPSKSTQKQKKLKYWIKFKGIKTIFDYIFIKVVRFLSHF